MHLNGMVVPSTIMVPTNLINNALSCTLYEYNSLSMHHSQALNWGHLHISYKRPFRSRLIIIWVTNGSNASKSVHQNILFLFLNNVSMTSHFNLVSHMLEFDGQLLSLDAIKVKWKRRFLRWMSCPYMICFCSAIYVV